VGEVLSSVQLLARLRAEHPSRRLFVSSTTLAGRALAAGKLAGLVDGVFYAPVDYCCAIRRVLRRLRPSVVVVMETEIWPNWYREVKRTGAGLLVANGRISDKALPRYDRFRWFLRHVLSWPDKILAQSEASASRYVRLGAAPAIVENAGNLKYDFDPDAARTPPVISRVIERAAPDEIWIAASTMPPAGAGDPDEDDVVIEAFQQLSARRPGLLLLHVPRRPNRFDEAAEKLAAAGVSWLRRSELQGGEKLALPGVLLMDSIGELSGLFGLGDVVFMGGTLAHRGGHNILEPAYFRKAIVIGPHMENFPEIAAEFRRGGGVVEIREAAELAGAVQDLLADSKRRGETGAAALALAEARGGAAETALAGIRHLSGVSVAELPPTTLAYLFLLPLTWLWAVGTAWKKSAAMRNRRRLRTPVISVGGIGMGGAGKTPFTLHLARNLKEQGESPAILTRGYRRRVPEKSTVLPAGTLARITLTGDEAQLFLRAGVADVGIGADRFATGKALEERLHPSVMLLDDGFQHWRLKRDLDIVLIDALEPFTRGALFPLGRLREPMEALRRADLFLITRAEPGAPLLGIERRLREHNLEAPIFRSSVTPSRWISVGEAKALTAKGLADRPMAAFCGLANPASFWRSLAGLGYRPTNYWSFRDHHHYKPQEVKRMAAEARAAGAEVLVTTEKDLMNLPSRAADLAAPLELFWLEIGLKIVNEEDLLEFIRENLAERVDRRRGRGPNGSPRYPGEAS